MVAKWEKQAKRLQAKVLPKQQKVLPEKLLQTTKQLSTNIKTAVTFGSRYFYYSANQLNIYNNKYLIKINCVQIIFLRHQYHNKI